MLKVITKLVPVKVWLVLGFILIQVMVISTAFKKGVDKERVRNQAAVQEAIDKYTNDQLSLLQSELKEALSISKAREVISSDQERAIASIKNKSKKLQEALDEAIKANTDSTCNNLDDSYIRLYEQMYNKTPADREN